MSSYENIHHAIDTGLRNMTGENHPNCHISESDADTIGMLLSTTDMTASQISNYLGGNVTERIVFNIMSGISWKNIYDKYGLNNINRNPSILSLDQIHSICKYFELNKRCNMTVNEYFSHMLNILNIDINESTLRISTRLYYKLTHKDICMQYNY